MNLLDGFQDSLTSRASEESKSFITEHVADETLQYGLELGLDTLVNSIPGIGSAITSFRNKRTMKNLMKLIKELDQRIWVIQENLKARDVVDSELIDSIVNTAVEKALKSEQEEKIEFIIYGLERVLENDEISFDVASLYFDTIDRLTLLDIAVLKFYRTPFDLETGGARSVETIMSTFNVDIDIFQATRANLRTIGLLETKTDKKISKDIENLYKSLSSLTERVNTISTAFKEPKKSNKVKSNKLSVNRIESRDRFEISKFGRDFHDYFIAENPYKED